MTLLSELTTLRLGGPACRLVACETENALVETVRAADDRRVPLLLLAGGSNVVAADSGFPGTVARILTSGVERRPETDRALLRVQAGEPWDSFVERCVRQGLAGIECLSGIPGSVGATPIQNVGAYGQEVRETISAVRVFDRIQQRVRELKPDDCRFSYRSSAFKRDPERWVVLAVTFALKPQPDSMPLRYSELAGTLGLEIGATAPLQAVRSAVMELRRAKGMVLDPNDPDTVSAGSFFLNPILDPTSFARLERRAAERGASAPPAYPQPDGTIKTSAAWLIQQAGFHRGYGNPDGIAISSKHTLALSNRGSGTTAELVALAQEIAGAVKRDLGVELTPEPVFVGVPWESR